MSYSEYSDLILQASKNFDDGNKACALSLYLDAMEKAPEKEDTLEPLYALGLLMKDDNAEEAEVYFKKCSKVAKEFKDGFYYTYYYNSEKQLGEIGILKSNKKKALHHLKKALKEIEKNDDDPDTLDDLKETIKALEKKSA